MKTRPLPFQWEVIRFIEEKNGRCFCFLDRGTGKSYVTLAYQAIHPEMLPSLIVCPASLKLNWRKEAKMHAGLPAIVLSGRKPQQITAPCIHIINYDIVHNWIDYLLEANFQFLAFDEAQALKNMETLRSKACKRLAMHIPKAIALTGTPITNRPIDFYNIAHTIVPNMFTNKYSYMYRYCGAKKINGILKCDGATNQDKLHEIIKPHMIRVRKADVLPQLPEKNVQVMPISLSNRKAYDKEYAIFLNTMAEMRKSGSVDLMKIYAMYNKLTQLITKGKMEDIHEWIDVFLESDSKLVYFMTHTAPLHEIYKKHKDHAVMIDGSVSAKNRDQAVEAFQKDDNIRLFCGNIVAAGVGLTLTASDTVAFGELSHIPADHLQAQDRVNRIGQTSNHINVYYLIADNTLEDKMCSNLLQKMVDIDHIIDGKITDAKDLDLRKELCLSL